MTRAELAEAAGADGARSGGYRMTQQILKVFQKKRNSRFYCFAHLKSKGNKIVFVSIKCIATSNIKTMYEFFLIRHMPSFWPHLSKKTHSTSNFKRKNVKSGFKRKNLLKILEIASLWLLILKAFA